MNKGPLLLFGVAATIGVAELWHGPLGAAAELQARVEGSARRTLDAYELPQITARLDQRPLSRKLILKGPADDFQRRALVEVLGNLPGVNEVRWDPSSPVVDHFAERRRKKQ